MEESRHPWGWSNERRARQANMIHLWMPWRAATGPTTAAGKAIASRNALKPSPIRDEVLALQAELAEARRLARAVDARRRSRCQL